MRPKITIIGTVGIPAKYGGFETLAENLTLFLQNSYNFTVYCSSKRYSIKLDFHNNAQLEYLNINANGIMSIFYDIISILKSYRKSDLLLILGVSGCIVLPFVKKFSNCKLIVNIDGLEHQRKKWNGLARLFLKLSEKIAVKYSDVVISDNKVIQDYIFSNYNKNSKLIEYGGDSLDLNSIQSVDPPKKIKMLLKKSYCLSICRIEPENNIEIILKAFSSQNIYQMVIVGNWDYSKYGRSLKEEYEQHNQLNLLNPIYDPSQLYLLRTNSKIYIHGHSAGGTNPSLVEAMNISLPIIAFDVNFNRETTEDKAVYFSNEQELLNILTNMDDKALLDISGSMKNISEKRYKWQIISNKYHKQFIAVM